MKKVISMMLAVLTAWSLTACAARTGTDAEQASDGPADALTLLQTVWALYTDEEKFPASGGDYSEENMTDGAPGRVGLEDVSSVEYLLSIPSSVLEQADDAASLIHMMNTNSFTCGVLRLNDVDARNEAAQTVKTYIMSKQWMCGFPDKLVVASVGDYLIEVFGLSDFVDPFCEKLKAAYPETVVISEDPIA